MMRRINSCSAPLCLLVLGATWLFSTAHCAWSWGDGGHMMVAAIAYPRLNAHAKSEADRLLALAIEPADVTNKSLDFVHASYWPDEVRRLPGFEFSGDLHFIDIPFAVDQMPLPTDLPKAENVVFALTKYVGILQNSHDNKQKAQALRFVIHFVGDIHQPLHCVTRVDQAHPQGDKGGNDFSVLVRDAGNETHSVKLHSFWDGGLGTFPKTRPGFVPPPMEEIPPAIESALHDNPDTNPAWQGGSPFNYTGWMQESVDIAKSKVYQGLQEGQEVRADYIRDGVPIARQRVAWAGYRLAALLNAVWPQ